MIKRFTENTFTNVKENKNKQKNSRNPSSYGQTEWDCLVDTVQTTTSFKKWGLRNREDVPSEYSFTTVIVGT